MEGEIWVGSLTAAKAPSLDELKIWIIQEYYKIMNLFGELLAKSLPSY
jgi:hypothetical protein